MLPEFLQETFHRFGGSFTSWSDEVAPGSTCACSLDQAVEFLVDETSRRLRAVSGYSRRLKRPIATAFHHIDEVVEQVPGVLSCRRATFGEDPRVNAFFVNTAHLQEVFSESKEVRELFDSNSNAGECFALLCMQRTERRRFGVEGFGDKIRRDVMQTTVSFSDHQVVSPGVSETDARCALKCCIFRSLIAYIRNEAAKGKTRTIDLESRHSILRSRLRQLERQPTGGTRRKELESEINAIEKELQDLNPRLATVEDHLQFVVDVLSHPEQFLYGRTHDIYIDRMGIKREDSANRSVFKLSLAEIQVTHQQPRVAALVRFPREELLPEKDFLHEASIFLAH